MEIGIIAIIILLGGMVIGKTSNYESGWESKD